MADFFLNLFENTFMPHGHCYMWKQEIVYLHVLSDGLITASYIIIPLLLFRFIQKRDDIEFKGIFLLFSAFILLCGLTHVLEIWAVWNGTYRLTGIVKAITGIVSFFTAYQLYKVLPFALAIPSPRELEDVNQKLQAQIETNETIVERTSKSLAMFETLFESSPDAIIVCNNEGLIEQVNRQLESTFGYTREELWKQPVEILIPERFTKQHKIYRNSYIKSANLRPMGKGKNLWGKKKNGEEFPVDIMLNPVQFDGSSQIIAVIRDVTEKHEKDIIIQHANEILEKRVEQRTRDLELKNKELENFVFIASHDLQEPLRKIRAFGDRLISKYNSQLDEKASDFLSRMQNAAERMQILIEELLKYSRIQKEKLTFTTIDLNHVVNEVLEDIELLIEKNNAEITIDKLPTLQGDKVMLKQLFSNLIGNAIKYKNTNEPPLIHIKHTLEPNGYHILVIDNGIGFDMKYHQRIFEAFQRLHGKDEYPGTGMGLAICNKIIELHKGNIHVQSEQGKGSTFNVFLPKIP